jgi:hypothetical protein
MTWTNHNFLNVIQYMAIVKHIRFDLYPLKIFHYLNFETFHAIIPNAKIGIYNLNVNSLATFKFGV